MSKSLTYRCYRCGSLMPLASDIGMESIPEFMSGCECNFGWFSTKRPNQTFIQNLPQDWFCHTGVISDDVTPL